MKIGDVLDERWVLVSGPLKGGTASVWGASDATEEHVRVAVKIVDSKRLDNRTADICFNREYAALQRIGSHPNIVSLLDAGKDAVTGKRYLVLPWLPRSMAKELREAPPVGWDSYYDSWGRPLIDALAFAHGNQVFHRDFKPENVLVGEKDRPMVTDFGISRFGDAVSIGQTVADFSSYPYTPEKFTPEAYRGTIDVHAYAATAVLALTSVEVDTSDPFGSLHIALNQLDVPEAIDAILRQALAEDAADRFQSAEVLKDRLDIAMASRRALQVAARPSASAIRLNLTNHATEKLEFDLQVDGDELVERILDDLRTQATLIFQEPRSDRKEQSFLLIGESIQLRVAVDSKYEDSYVVVDGFLATPSLLDDLRARGCDVPFDFSIGSSAVTPATSDDLAFLAVQAAEANASFRFQREKDAAERRFMTWRKTLGALRATARAQEAPLDYTAVRKGATSQFELKSPVPDDAIGQERTVRAFDGAVVRGEITSATGSRIKMRLTDGDPDQLPETGTLKLDTRASVEALKRQERALDALETGDCARPNLRALLADPSTSMDPTPQQIRTWRNGNLDQAKKIAVSTGLGTQDFLLVEGPPGTGKTTFITELIEQLVEADTSARILLAAQTHAALDNVLEKLQKSAPTMKLLRIARDDSLQVSESVRGARIDAQLKSWKSASSAAASNWINHKAKADQLDPGAVRRASQLSELRGLLISATSLAERLGRAEAGVAAMDVEDRPNGSTEPEALQVLRAERILARRELDDCVADIDESFSRCQRAGALARDIQRDSLSVDEVEAALDLAGERNAPEWQRVEKLLALQSEWLARFGVGPEFETAAISRANVVAATCVGLGAIRGLDSLEFDFCIIDEASKANASEMLVPMTRAHRWLLVGDDKQLPPFIDEALRDPELLRDHGLARQDVEETLFETLSSCLPKDSVVALNEQHRMLPPIGDLISDCFYDGALKSAAKKHPPWIGNPVIPQPVCWFSTSRLGKRRLEKRSGKNLSNPTEVQRVESVLGRVSMAVGRRRSAIPVAVLSPYGSQTASLSRMTAAQAHNWKNLTVECGTVDSFQGREADVVILSLTRSNAAGELGFLSDTRRINVALSRARECLLIVGDDRFASSAPRGESIADVLSYIREHPGTCAIEDLE